MDVIVVGAGLAGLSVAYHIKQGGLDYELYERDSKIGGLCKSDMVKGFTFDRTLHVLFMKNQYVKTLIKETIGEKFLLHKRRALVHFNGAFIPYPFQVYFPMLPFPSVIEDCITGLESCERSYGNLERKNLKEWIYYTFGDGIAEHFMVPYNRKLWTIPLDEVICDWTAKYVPRPNVKEILHFMKKNPRKMKREYGYNVEFQYPLRGGIEVLPKYFASNLNNERLHLSCEVRTILLREKKILFSDGDTVKWNVLVSTIPLPQLVFCIKDVPSTIREAASNLRYISIYNLNLGIDEKETTRAHWIYFPEHTFVFHRVGFPSNLSPHMAPSGLSSLSVEVSYSKYKPLPKEKLDSIIVRDLMKARLINHKNAVLVKKAFNLPYAYVIYDQGYNSSRQKILSFLEREGIFSVGRYGSWEYSTMEDAILAGKNVAGQILHLFSH